MRDNQQSIPPNVFSESFLQLLSRREESPSASEADYSGPWVVRPTGRGFGVFREWAAEGEKPDALLEYREHALVLVAVLPAAGREPLFHVSPAEDPEGYALETIWGESWIRAIGRMRQYHPEIADALNVAEALVRSPSALAYLLEATGPTGLKLTGEILAHRLAQQGQTGDG